MITTGKFQFGDDSFRALGAFHQENFNSNNKKGNGLLALKYYTFWFLDSNE